MLNSKALALQTTQPDNLVNATVFVLPQLRTGATQRAKDSYSKVTFVRKYACNACTRILNSAKLLRQHRCSELRSCSKDRLLCALE